MSTQPIAEHALRSAGWRQALASVLTSDAHRRLEARVAAAREAGVRVLPCAEQVYAAYNATPLDAVRVVIIGQDPYPTPGHAHGLAFSYLGRGTRPRSLTNIVRELERDVGLAIPDHACDLTPWAEQGVLLLNRVLSVQAGDAGSHRGWGWEALTEATVDVLAARAEPVVFILWGRQARRLASRIAAPHHVLEAGHPSPLSVRHFRGCAHFTRTNELVRGEPIQWSALATPTHGAAS